MTNHKLLSSAIKKTRTVSRQSQLLFSMKIEVVFTDGQLVQTFTFLNFRIKGSFQKNTKSMCENNNQAWNIEILVYV